MHEKGRAEINTKKQNNGNGWYVYLNNPPTNTITIPL